jgi:prepilin-type processing-associated H-X9-DG protein
MERQDIWDRLVDVNSEPGGTSGELAIRPIESLICPADTDATSDTELPALTYIANTGAWDREVPSGNFLFIDPTARVGDTTDNGIFLNLAEYSRNQSKAPSMRMSKIQGASTTIMLSENVNKDYEPVGGADSAFFTWLGGVNPSPGAQPLFGTEQQLGFVWVASANPQPGDDVDEQERINRDSTDPLDWDPTLPRFARPASNHTGGVNVAFADGHTQFLREDIDYIVYQRLLTSNGKKCVDPIDWGNPVGSAPPAIVDFRRAPVLSESDYQ